MKRSWLSKQGKEFISLLFGGLGSEEVRRGQKVNLLVFATPTSGKVFSGSLGVF